MSVLRFGCVGVGGPAAAGDKTQRGREPLHLGVWCTGWGLGGAAVGGWPGGLVGGLVGLVMGLTGLAWARRHQATMKWRRWSDHFLASLPARLNTLAQHTTESSLFHAGLRLGTRLLEGRTPEVPEREHPGEVEPRRRLIGWVSQQCFRAPTAFHRGLWAALERRDRPLEDVR